MKYSDMSELASQIDEALLVQTTLGELRTALGYDRLGRYVLNQIKDKLEEKNLGYFPLWVLDDNDEPRQHHTLRIYRRTSSVGKAVRAVTHPSQDGDKHLISVLSRDDAATIAQIKALVCD